MQVRSELGGLDIKASNMWGRKDFVATSYLSSVNAKKGR